LGAQDICSENDQIVGTPGGEGIVKVTEEPSQAGEQSEIALPVPIPAAEDCRSVESQENKSTSLPPAKARTLGITATQALKMAQMTQASPHDAKTSIMDRKRERKKRDSMKEQVFTKYQFSQPPRKRMSTNLNQVNAYPGRKTLKNRPGQNYESPYAVKHVLP